MEAEQIADGYECWEDSGAAEAFLFFEIRGSGFGGPVGVFFELESTLEGDDPVIDDGYSIVVGCFGGDDDGFFG